MMARQKGASALPLVQRISLFLERFREMPAVSWVITTGAVTIFAALQVVAFPTMTRVQVLCTYAAVLVISILGAGLYAVRHPSLSQRMLEARKHYSNGCIAFEDRRYDLAIEEFRLSCDKDPENYPYVSKYGRACLRLGKYEEAIAALTRARDVSPATEGKFAATRNRGIAAMVVNDWGLAHSDFTEYLEKNKGNRAVHRLRALVYLATRDFSEAEADARVAVNVAPKECSVHATLATVLGTIGDSDGGRKALAKALTLDHEKGDPLYALAQASAALGDTDEAFRRLEKAVQVDAKFGPRARRDPVFTKIRVNESRFAAVTNTQGRVAVGSLDEWRLSNSQ